MCLCPAKSQTLSLLQFGGTQITWRRTCMLPAVHSCYLSRHPSRELWILYPLPEARCRLPRHFSSSLCPRCSNFPSSNSETSGECDSSFLLALVISAWSHPSPSLHIFLPFFFFFLNLFSDFTFQADVKQCWDFYFPGNHWEVVNPGLEISSTACCCMFCP